MWLIFDSSVLEVYSGAESKEDTASKRFTCIGGANDTVPALVKSFPFTELPETQHDFIEAVCVEQYLVEEDGTEDDSIEDHRTENDSIEDDSMEDDSMEDDGIDDGSDDDGIEDYGIEDDDTEDDDIDDCIEQQWIMPTLSF